MSFFLVIIHQVASCHHSIIPLPVTIDASAVVSSLASAQSLEAAQFLKLSLNSLRRVTRLGIEAEMPRDTQCVN